MPPTPSSIAFMPRALVGALVAFVAALALLVASPAVAQEFGTTTAVAGTVAETDPETGTETQTLVEAEPQEDRFLTSESRRIVVAIGGLVVVALLLMLVTIRYWRQTKPVAPAVDESHEAEADSTKAREPGPVAPQTEEVAAVGGEDHAAVDEAWEPLATGEHARVDLPDPGRLPRPSAEARRKALGRT